MEPHHKSAWLKESIRWRNNVSVPSVCAVFFSNNYTVLPAKSDRESSFVYKVIRDL